MSLFPKSGTKNSAFFAERRVTVSILMTHSPGFLTGVVITLLQAHHLLKLHRLSPAYLNFFAAFQFQ
jgi:hypothetical protein